MGQDTSEKTTDMITIREATEKDAENLIALRQKLYRETNFLLLEPDEYNPTVKSEAAFISAFRQSGNSTVLLAFADKTRLIGFMGVAGGTTNRSAHKATIFMGILKEFWGKGAGKQLFDALFQWSADTSLQRLELTTALNNERAYALYQKVGFETECVKKLNIIVDGAPVDEYQMALFLPGRNELL